MNKALKPCPFCGGSDVYMGRDPGDERDHVVWCRSCGAHGGVGYYPGLARENWNRRAERTCHYVYDREICAWRCSECGGLETVGDHVRCCPDCGARVVGTDDR